MTVSHDRCCFVLQVANPVHLWKLWDPEVRLQRRCLARNNSIMAEKVQALRKTPPAAHTIAGECLIMWRPAKFCWYDNPSEVASTLPE
jgi:hypothetical protein